MSCGIRTLLRNGVLEISSFGVEPNVAMSVVRKVEVSVEPNSAMVEE
jgi:hypothetical protein